MSDISCIITCVARRRQPIAVTKNIKDRERETERDRGYKQRAIKRNQLKVTLKVARTMPEEPNDETYFSQNNKEIHELDHKKRKKEKKQTWNEHNIHSNDELRVSCYLY